MYPQEIRKSIYIPIATFVTSYARKKTIETSQKIRDFSLNKYGVDLVEFNNLPKADCVIVAVGHNEFRSMSTMQLKELFKDNLPDGEKVLIDVKSLYRYDELVASGMKFWRL